jgi:hypothetical protein
MPFSTDDTAVTAPGALHIEAFDELDALQSSQYSARRQNTDNLKLNAGLPYPLEIDLDAPYLNIDRAGGSASSQGIGNTDCGLKWQARSAIAPLHAPALAASFYVEVSTGNVRQELGSGLSDYWLNLIAQEPPEEHTRLNLNLGILFAGNTSTGAVGIETTRGQVYTGGLSVLHEMSDQFSLGAEIYGGISSNTWATPQAAPGHGRDAIKPAQQPCALCWVGGRRVCRGPEDWRSTRNRGGLVAPASAGNVARRLLSGLSCIKMLAHEASCRRTITWNAGREQSAGQQDPRRGKALGRRVCRSARDLSCLRPARGFEMGPGLL